MRSRKGISNGGKAGKQRQSWDHSPAGKPCHPHITWVSFQHQLLLQRVQQRLGITAGKRAFLHVAITIEATRPIHALYTGLLPPWSLNFRPHIALLLPSLLTQHLINCVAHGPMCSGLAVLSSSHHQSFSCTSAQYRRGSLGSACRSPSGSGMLTHTFPEAFLTLT